MARWCLPAAALLNSPRVVPSLELKVVVHYPEKDSAVDHCSSDFQVSTSFGDPAASVTAIHIAPDTFEAVVELDDSHLYTQGEVSVSATIKASYSQRCQETCPRTGPQGNAVMYGPYPRTGPLAPTSRMDIWPSFCELDWTTHNVSFFSTALDKQVTVLARVPAVSTENPLPRPSSMLPPVMFRLNPEWYWPHNHEIYNTWHDLMTAGHLHYFVVAEVHVEGVTWQSWHNLPIMSGERLRDSCTVDNKSVCDDETQFVCDSWQGHAYTNYLGGHHSYTAAGAFWDELYDTGLAGILKYLPGRADEGQLRVGAWGYCIGGLGAWTAMLHRPDRYNMGYLGSPAVDFDCGDTLRAADTYDVSSLPVRPKIFIDSGGAEGVVMNRMTLLLFRKLQSRGLVDGQDLFYERAPFGSHEGRSLLRRAHSGVLALFGAARQSALAPGSPGCQAMSLADAGGELWPEGWAPLRGPEPAQHDWFMFTLLACAILGAFVVGRRSVPAAAGHGSASTREPLLVA